MNVREAKDFLVQQTVEQAALDHVPLSDLERRMMYFTEGPDATENTSALDEEFEAEYDTEEFEAKTSKLLHHGYRRVLKEDKLLARRWKESIRTLRKGDHYLLVLWDQGPTERPPYDSLKLLGTAVLVVVIGLGVMMGIVFLADKYNIHWNSGPQVYRPTSPWIQRAFFLVVILGYCYFVVLPLVLKKPPGLAALLAKLVGAFLKNRSQR